MFTGIITWLQNIIETLGPIGIGIATFVESICAPIPSEPILVLAGTTVESLPELFLFTLGATIGSYFGTLQFYLIGRKSRGLMINIVEKYGMILGLTVEKVESAENLFNTKGKSIVFFGRLIPLVRTVISIPAGICKMDFKIYSILTLSGSFLWNTLLIGLGFLFRNDYQKVLEFLDQYDKVVILSLLAIGVIYIGWTKLKPKK